MNVDYTDLNEVDKQRIETLVESGTSHDDAVAQVRAEKIAASGVSDTAKTGTTLADPRDARIAELEQQVADLKAAAIGTSTTTVSTEPLSVEDRTAELEGQGLSAEDAAEQAAYEARTKADNSPPPVQTTV